MSRLFLNKPSYASSSSQLGKSVVDDLMARALVQKDLLSIAAGFTDNECLPMDLVSEAVQGLAAEGRTDVLQYGSNQGRLGLRKEALRCLSDHPGESSYQALPDCDSVLISNGSQQSLYLAMQTLCEPGDIVLVQAPTYFVFVELARGLGIEMRSLPTHDDGSLDLTALPQALDALKASGEFHRVKAVYFVSYFANPTAHSLSVMEKVGLADELSKRSWYLPVVEDAAYRDIWFGRPPEAASVMSIDAFETFPRLYLGTFTKPFATGLRVGYGIFSDPEWCQRCARLKSHQDFGTANFNQSIIERVILTEGWQRFQVEMRVHYTRKKDAFIEALGKTRLKDLGFEWEEPLGGLLLWARGPKGVDTGIESRLFKAALDHKVLYVPGAVCMPEQDAKVSTMRLSFGALDADLFPEALKRLEQAVIACL